MAAILDVNLIGVHSCGFSPRRYTLQGVCIGARINRNGIDNRDIFLTIHCGQKKMISPKFT